MLKTIDISNSFGSTLSFNLFDDEDGILIDNVDGLDPVKATIKSSKFAQFDGSQFQAASLTTRNILVTFSLVPSLSQNTASKLRNKLYQFLFPKSVISMKFTMDDGFQVETQGVVESLETSLFSKDPVVVASILTFDPEFSSTELKTLNSFTTTGSSGQSFIYDGNAPSGFLVEIVAASALTELSIYRQDESGETLSFGYNLATPAGSTLSINSNPGSKYIRLKVNGVSTSVLYAIQSGSSWVSLSPGVNMFRVQTQGSVSPYTLTYNEKYGGL